MAENESGEEKTEDPSEKKLQKSRDDGQVARSKELTTTFVLLGGVVGIATLGGEIGQAWMVMMKFNFSVPREAAFDQTFLLTYLATSAYTAIEAALPLFLVLFVAAVTGPIALGGILFSAKALAPKFSKLNPLKGIKRMFSLTALVELVKSIAKVIFIGGVAAMVLLYSKAPIIALAQAPLEMAIAHMTTIIGWSLVVISTPMILISMIDVPYQIFDHNKQLKMTRQEMKDEFKDTEGKPEVKSKVRQMQYDMAQRRMMQAVPEADVVITNPEHFSVALKYDTNNSGAPIVVAKGIDFMAIKIREAANAHDVMILETPPLARAIYFTTELDQEIPNTLYLAVAQVLAYVFQLKAYEKGEGRRPKPYKDAELPQSALFDAEGRKLHPEK